MRPKNLSKKLRLNKTTIVRLDNGKTKNIYGGENTPAKPDSIFFMTCGEPICETVTGDPCIAC